MSMKKQIADLNKATAKAESVVDTYIVEGNALLTAVGRLHTAQAQLRAALNAYSKMHPSGSEDHFVKVWCADPKHKGDLAMVKEYVAAEADVEKRAQIRSISELVAHENKLSNALDLFIQAMADKKQRCEAKTKGVIGMLKKKLLHKGLNKSLPVQENARDAAVICLDEVRRVIKAAREIGG